MTLTLTDLGTIAGIVGVLTGFIGFVLSMYVGAKISDVKSWTAELLKPITTSMAVYEEKFHGYARDLGSVTTSVKDINEQMSHNRANIHDIRNKLVEAVTGVAVLQRDLDSHAEQDKDNFARLFGALEKLERV